MRNNQLCWAFALVGSVVGCGGADEELPIGPPGDRIDADPGAIDAAIGDGQSPDGGTGDASLGGSDGSTDGAVDPNGPTITVVSPTPGSINAGTVRFVLTIEDPDGVDPASVTTTVAGTYSVALFPGETDQWVGNFDSLPLAGLVFPAVVVRAADLAGNENQLGFIFALDNVPPVAEIDPPFIREWKRSSEGVVECSQSFDPVGGDAANDGESVAQLVELRARIQDRANGGSASSSVAVPYAGVDDSTVRIYVLDDSDRPLIVDTDGDGRCDAINPTIVPTVVPNSSNEAAVVDLIAIEAAGASDFSEIDAVAGGNMVCNVGEAPDPPTELCFAADGVTRVPQTFDGFPVIYSIPPSTEFGCMGYAFDTLASNISDGWACAAIESGDNLGNLSVSPVVRLCVDADGDQVECPPWRTISAVDQRPDCTGTYDPGTGTVTSTPCSPPDEFYDSGVTGEYELFAL
jgi:hypothetical protein